jgi:flagellar basal-body rod protein FlgG
MNVSLYQAAAALSANSQWQDIIADNLASGSVPGFRKQTLSTAAIQAGLMPATGLNSSGAAQFFSIPQTSVSTSFKSGELNFTGDNNNAAIEGKGFFQVKLAHGTVAVTRDGEFRVNAQHQLGTKEGYPVMGKNGPIQLDPDNHGPISITADGQVSQGSELKGKLSLTDFENPELLTQTNGVYFLPTNPALKSKAATGSLRNGYVEGANTNSLGEMANMMTAMRGFEANGKIIQIQDERLGKVISELGNPS